MQIAELTNRGVRLVILKQGFDTATPAGKLALTMFAVFTEFENGTRCERQLEGIKRARAEGKYQGRKPKLSAEQQVEFKRRIYTGENRSELAREFNIGRVTVHRYAAMDVTAIEAQLTALFLKCVAKLEAQNKKAEQLSLFGVFDECFGCGDRIWRLHTCPSEVGYPSEVDSFLTKIGCKSMICAENRLCITR